MSEDGFSDGFEEPNMEIQIKTLMGTTFDIKVSSTETVEDIKKKIYRVEGIPIYQQNLIFQSRELKDRNRLGDAGIRNGSTLTLVASMRGGPISTRRLSVACEHHVMLKELKELLENTRDEIAPGSKVSVLVFKEGDIINLLRVIENEDGSYSPYSEKPISPPQKPARRECRTGIFERLVEDSEMSTKMANLRQKMEELSVRKRSKTSKAKTTAAAEAFGEPSKSAEGKTHPLSFKFLAECGNDFLDNVNLKIFEKNFEEESEEEIALKEKHRSKPHKTAKIKSKSLYNESKGAYSHTKQNYARIHKKTRDLHAGEGTSRERTLDDLSPRKPMKELTSSLAEQFAVLEEDNQDLYGESVSVSARNRVHLTRLVLSETAERPKSSPNSIELEENAQDLWEIHEPASERLKHSATCKVGLLKRRQSLDYGYEGIENAPKPEIGNYSCKNSEFEVCSGNFYHMPQFVSSPSAIPPQYAPKDQGLCDYYFSKPSRSPLYGRKSKEDAATKEEPSTEKGDGYNFLSECSGIQRLKNEGAGTERDTGLFSGHDTSIDELYGYYNLGCSAELLGERATGQPPKLELPPVVKKRARCSECNKRLNITNIHNCRCGKIFCSQHRYSEVHRCSYDYKTEGRKILEQQNPLVTAEKVNRI
ncbi:AN1-type zinc finger protein 4-like [Anoplophora glabripennis]|uniref:AN1-type zinc finger protein 4-like n=1 Tax=Anoplophora glabripennis TaxID=217634 RepID=UPI0008746C51|nr:AN1-type zinc finger protein 4-like [Anoplophora glabripennis]